MKKTHIIIALVVAAAAVCLGLYLNRDTGQEKRLTVAYSSPGDANGWFQAFSAELEKEAKKRGYKFSVTHAKSNTARQLSDVEDIVAAKPDILIFGPRETVGSAEALATAKKAGITVIVVTRDIVGKHKEDYITKIYSDFDWIGEKMADAVYEAFDPNTELIRVVEIHGTLGGGNTKGMSRGLRKGIAKHPNMKLVLSQLGDFNRDTAMKTMKSILTSPVKFDAIVCHYDAEAMGVIQALRGTAFTPGNDPKKGEIIIVGNGGTKAGLDAVKKGVYHKIISVSPYYADKVFDAIDAHRKGQKLPPYIRVDDFVIDKNNVDKHMPKAF